MIVVSQHVGASALHVWAESGPLFGPRRNCGAGGFDARGHQGVSTAPIQVGMSSEDLVSDAPPHVDRGVASVGDGRSTKFGGSCSMVTGGDGNDYRRMVQAPAGRVSGLGVEFDADVFDAVGIYGLIEGPNRVLVARTADSGQQS